MNPMNSLEMHVGYLIGDIENWIAKFEDNFKRIGNTKQSVFKTSVKAKRAVRAIQKVFNLIQPVEEEFDMLVLSSQEVIDQHVDDVIRHDDLHSIAREG